jgi:NADPH2:quinone reductase
LIPAVGIVKVGGDFQRLNLRKEALEANEVTIKVHAVGVNPIDFKKRALGWGEVLPVSVDNPFVLGFDGSGVVVEVSEESVYGGLKVGDEVYWAGDLSRKGSHAQYQIVDSRIVARKPKSLDFTQASSVPLVALTAWEALVENAGLIPDN